MNELAKNVYSAWRTARRRAKARAKGIKPEELDQYDLGVCADDDEEGDDLEKKRSATVEDHTTRSAKRRKPFSSSSSSCTPSPSEHQELELSLVDVVPSPPAVCDNDSDTATIPVPQMKLKNPLDGITSTLFRVPPTPLPSPVAREHTAPISQPNAHVNEPVGESPGSEAPVGTTTLPLVVAAISNGQPEPTPAVSSSINGAVRVEPAVEAPKKASKARPSNKKNGR
ncbi:hypothetical protein DEU56DRAFT_839840 [Suillus clintonianus]|uniref:uncharacterized protein n=1 Tax=Suillus clintonianus TaxID=1904413 RepID=UPI001B871883|nr:uncharacterized protein DEU56DRAFT_839840 [Suillus clintonianus]KAG2116851.1 hypothetical protein DEU56DRAFT_839840 [Suillus clintonianus]